MANILVNLEHGVEVAACDVLRFLTTAQAVATKLEPGVIAALGVLLGATKTALMETSDAIATPTNITLDLETISDLREVWPAIVAFARAVGIQL